MVSGLFEKLEIKPGLFGGEKSGPTKQPDARTLKTTKMAY